MNRADVQRLESERLRPTPELSRLDLLDELIALLADLCGQRRPR
jgi:hypothetical protein